MHVVQFHQDDDARCQQWLNDLLKWRKTELCALCYLNMVAEPSSSTFRRAMVNILWLILVVTHFLGGNTYELDRSQHRRAPRKFERLTATCEDQGEHLLVACQTSGTKTNYILDEPNVQFMVWSQDYIPNYDLEKEYNVDMNESKDFGVRPV